MSRRSEYDAHNAMKPKSYAEGYIDGQRAARNKAQQKRDREALSALITWMAWRTAGRCKGYRMNRLLPAVQPGPDNPPAWFWIADLAVWVVIGVIAWKALPWLF